MVPIPWITLGMNTQVHDTNFIDYYILMHHLNKPMILISWITYRFRHTPAWYRSGWYRRLPREETL